MALLNSDMGLCRFVPLSLLLPQQPPSFLLFNRSSKDWLATFHSRLKISKTQIFAVTTHHSRGADLPRCSAQEEYLEEIPMGDRDTCQLGVQTQPFQSAPSAWVPTGPLTCKEGRKLTRRSKDRESRHSGPSLPSPLLALCQWQLYSPVSFLICQRGCWTGLVVSTPRGFYSLRVWGLWGLFQRY